MRQLRKKYQRLRKHVRNNTPDEDPFNFDDNDMFKSWMTGAPPKES